MVLIRTGTGERFYPDIKKKQIGVPYEAPKYIRRKSKNGTQPKGRSVEYVDYIRSREWADRRVRYYKTHARLCAVCEQFAEHLHHKTYKRLGKERDDDLVPLCEYHHDKFHELHGTSRNMEVSTVTFIQSARLDLEAARVVGSF